MFIKLPNQASERKFVIRVKGGKKSEYFIVKRNKK